MILLQVSRLREVGRKMLGRQNVSLIRTLQTLEDIYSGKLIKEYGIALIQGTPIVSLRHNSHRTHTQ